jgi:hypothetical protein
MASAPARRAALKPAKACPAMNEDARINAALRQAVVHARKQLAAQGLKLPTQGWKRARIYNPVV